MEVAREVAVRLVGVDGVLTREQEKITIKHHILYVNDMHHISVCYTLVKTQLNLMDI